MTKNLTVGPFMGKILQKPHGKAIYIFFYYGYGKICKTHTANEGKCSKPSTTYDPWKKSLPWGLKKPRYIGWDRSNPVFRIISQPTAECLAVSSWAPDGATEHSRGR